MGKLIKLTFWVHGTTRQANHLPTPAVQRVSKHVICQIPVWVSKSRVWDVAHDASQAQGNVWSLWLEVIWMSSVCSVLQASKIFLCGSRSNVGVQTWDSCHLSNQMLWLAKECKRKAAPCRVDAISFHDVVKCLTLSCIFIEYILNVC